MQKATNTMIAFYLAALTIAVAGLHLFTYSARQEARNNHQKIINLMLDTVESQR